MKGKLILLIFALFLPLAILSFLFSTDGGIITSHKDVSQTKRMLVGIVPISVEIADSVVTQTRGLSFRDSLGDNEGLLFVFAKDDTHGIWMKDMRFPIDIVWADAQGKIIHTESSVHPNTYPSVFGPQEKSRYVLELPSGFLDIHGVGAGNTLSFPLDF